MKRMFSLVILFLLLASITTVAGASKANQDAADTSGSAFSFDLKQTYSSRQDIVNDLKMLGHQYKEYIANNKNETDLKSATDVFNQRSEALKEQFNMFPDSTPDASKQLVDKIDSAQESISMCMDELQLYDLDKDAAKKNQYDQLKNDHDELDTLRNEFQESSITIDQGNQELSSITSSIFPFKTAN
ncbi:MAG: hypothetical protein P4L75_05240 [Clostridia bacterium]|nr:hypothetical protein [Clostridia bacterium]MDR3644120.1 hypothetical protein [Clostridia bacterium]